MRFFLGCLLAVISLSQSALAANQDSIRFQHLSRDDGLSQAFVLSIAQDKDGFMWFGTQEGLNRFDGYDTQVYTHTTEDDTSLPDNTVRALLVDQAGSLWVGTDNGGIARFIPESNQFKRYQSDSHNLTTNRIRVLHQDAAGRIWVGTDGGGLEQFDADKEHFIHSSDTLALFKDQSIWAIENSRDGHLWVGSRTGLYLFSPYVGILKHFPLENYNVTVRSIHETQRGEIWVGTDNNGVYRISPDRNHIEHYLHDRNDPNSISDNQIADITEDNFGTLWFGTANGLNRWEASDRFTRFFHDDSIYGLSNNIVRQIFQDSGNVIWVATYNGLSYWLRNEFSASLYTDLSNRAVTSFAETQDKSIWVGTFGGGVNVFDAAGEHKIYRHSVEDPDGLPDDDVMSLLVDSKDRIWVGTRTSGLLQMSPDGKVVKHFYKDHPTTPITGNDITHITEDRSGFLWVSTYSGGLNRLDPDNGLVNQYQQNPSRTGALKSNRIMTVMQDSRERIWIGTDGAGIARLDPIEGIFTHYTSMDGLSGDLVLNITEDDFGDIWIGTAGSGLNRWRHDDIEAGLPKFDIWTEADGLRSLSVYSMEWDDEGYLWISSNQGIARYDAQNSRFLHFDLSHGLQDLEFNSGAGYKLRDGSLLFGGINGFNRIDPTTVGANTHPPGVMITSIKKQGQQVNPFALADEGIELGYRDYQLELQFAGLDYASTQHNQYRYRLVGFDNDWIEAGTRRYASYTNLDSGKYTFEVQAANSDGVWSVKEASLNLTVLPAPWFSSWAYASYALLIMLISTLTWRIYVARQKYVHQVQHFSDEVHRINKTLSKEVGYRKQKEIEVRLEKERTQQFLDVADVMLAALDESGNILDLNETGLHLIGSESLIIGRNLSYFMDPEYTDTFFEVIANTRESGNPDLQMECTMYGGDGRLYNVLWRFSRLPDEAAGSPQQKKERIFASGTDITAIKDLEKTLRVQEKFSIAGTMAAGIAHDFNNILAAITGYSSLIQGQSTERETQTYVQKIIEASNRATDLVARMLVFTNREEHSLEPNNILPAITEAVDLLRGSLPAGIDIHLNLPEENRLVVISDTTQIHQLVMNLGVNAGRAMSDNHGTLTIDISLLSLSQDQLPAGSHLHPGNFVRMDFTDTGIGMTDEILKQVFDPFYKSSELGYGKRVGSGLGLSIVHSIVDAHKGHIDVKSIAGAGTTFSIWLPTSSASVKRAGDVIQLPTSSTQRSRILILDDEEWVADVAQKLLDREGHRGEVFHNPVEALAAFVEKPLRFDLIITDENMPGIKGSELIPQLRQYRQDIPVILMSGNLSEIQEDELTLYLRKPFTPESLNDMVNRILRTSKMRSQQER